VDFRISRRGPRGNLVRNSIRCPIFSRAFRFPVEVMVRFERFTGERMVRGADGCFERTCTIIDNAAQVGGHTPCGARREHRWQRRDPCMRMIMDRHCSRTLAVQGILKLWVRTNGTSVRQNMPCQGLRTHPKRPLGEMGGKPDSPPHRGGDVDVP